MRCKTCDAETDTTTLDLFYGMCIDCYNDYLDSLMQEEEDDKLLEEN